MSGPAGAGEHPSVTLFRSYLQCKSVHPDPTPGYEAAAVLLKHAAEEIGLVWRRVDLAPGHPILLMKYAGSDESLPSIVLSSHMDVVPVEPAKWSVDPWGGVVRDGKIYGRGAQDMKSVGIQYLEAVRRLAARGYRPRRTIYILWVPDEEVGGGRGIKLLLGSALIREMNPALVLDEGLASPSDRFTVFYGERKIWWLKVTATGAVGHGSRFVEGTAVPKLVRFFAAPKEWRARAGTRRQPMRLPDTAVDRSFAASAGRRRRVYDRSFFLSSISCASAPLSSASPALFHTPPISRTYLLLLESNAAAPSASCASPTRCSHTMRSSAPRSRPPATAASSWATSRRST